MWALPNSDLQMIATRLALLPGGDRRPQAGPAGTDDQDVVGMPVRRRHPMIRRSEMVPEATNAMYRSVSIRVPSVVHANCMCFLFIDDTQVHIL